MDYDAVGRRSGMEPDFSFFDKAATIKPSFGKDSTVKG